MRARLLPMLATHLPFPQIAGQVFLSRHTVSRRCTRSTGSWAPAHRAGRPSGPASWDPGGLTISFHPIRGTKLTLARGGMVLAASGDTWARR